MSFNNQMKFVFLVSCWNALPANTVPCIFEGCLEILITSCFKNNILNKWKFHCLFNIHLKLDFELLRLHVTLIGVEGLTLRFRAALVGCQFQSNWWSYSPHTMQRVTVSGATRENNHQKTVSRFLQQSSRYSLAEPAQINICLSDLILETSSFVLCTLS